MRMYVGFIQGISIIVMVLSVCPHMHTDNSFSFSASLYIRMYAQKPQVMPILSHLEVHFLFELSYLCSSESGQAQVRQCNK